MKLEVTENALAVSFERILELTDRPRVAFEDILKALSGKGRFVILMLLTLPFCQPIQIPGFSTPFVIAIAFLGLRISLVKKYGFLRSF